MCTEDLSSIAGRRWGGWRRRRGLAAKHLRPAFGTRLRRMRGPEGWRRGGTRPRCRSGRRSAENLRPSTGWNRLWRRRCAGGGLVARAVGDKDVPATGALDWRPARRDQPVIECVVRLALRAADLHDSGPYHAWAWVSVCPPLGGAAGLHGAHVKSRHRATT
jgi:hypothetical protein